MIVAPVNRIARTRCLKRARHGRLLISLVNFRMAVSAQVCIHVTGLQSRLRVSCKRRGPRDYNKVYKNPAI